jgi:hypothetical protein
MSYLKKQGYLDPDGEVVAHPLADPLFQEHEALAQAASASIAGRIAFGPHAGSTVTKIGSGFGYGEEIPLAKGKRCYSVNGFSLHANTAINPLQRDGLEKLIQYMARGPLANERLEITADAQVKLQLKRPWSDGTSHLLFTPGELIEKLTALIPAPRAHLVRWAGVFAPNSPYRKDIALRPEVKKAFQFQEEASSEGKFRNHAWSRLLARVFKIDVTTCEDCGGKLKAISAVKDPDSVRRYLNHEQLDDLPPPRGPPRYLQAAFAFDPSSPLAEGY